MFGTVLDVTAQAEVEQALCTSEERQAFLLELSDALRPLSDPSAIRETASRLLGERLGVNRSFYAEVDGEEWLVSEAYEHDVERLARARHEIAQFGQWIIDTLRAGDPLVFSDLHADARFEASERSAHAAYFILASVAVPLVKDQTLAAILAVHSATPREWHEHESPSSRRRPSGPGRPSSGRAPNVRSTSAERGSAGSAKRSRRR